MAETKVDKKERKKLRVVSVNEIQKKGEHLEILSFKCDDNLVYQTTKRHLFPHIKADTEIDADTESQIITFDDGGQMAKWVVTEIYQDGKPVAQPESRGKGRYGAGGSSDASIEAQVAFKGMIELIIAGKIGDNSKEFKATIEWAMSRLHSVAQLKAQVDKAMAKTTKAEEKPEESPPEEAEPEIKTAGALLAWIMSKDKNIKAPRVWLNTNFDVDPKAVLTMEKVKELHEAIKSGMGW